MNNPIIMHINYVEIRGGSFGTRSIDEICAFAASLGYNGIEFRGAPPTEQAMDFAEYAAQIGAAKKKYGLTDIIFSLTVPDAAAPEAEKREAAVAVTLEKARLARSLCGSTVCNTSASVSSCSIPTVPKPGYEFHGSACAREADWEVTADTYRRIGKGLEDIGLKLAFETHMHYIHDLPATAKRLVDLIDSPMIGINLDYGNTVYFPVRPPLAEAIDQCGDKLFHTHLKNSLATPGTANLRLPTALGEGEINHRAYLKKLEEVGYTGALCIEAPRPGDRPWFAECDIAYLKKVMEFKF